MTIRNWKDSLNFSIAVPKGIQRFRELIVYISGKSEDDIHFGATKLNKILYYSDFTAFQKFGAPLTGVTYFRLPMGPAPKALLPVQNELISERAIDIQTRAISTKHHQKRTVALREAYLDLFTIDEIKLVDSVIDRLWSQNATEVSDASHDVRWKVLTNKDDIPYEFAFLSDESISDKDIQRTHELAAEHGWMERYRA